MAEEPQKKPAEQEEIEELAEADAVLADMLGNLDARTERLEAWTKQFGEQVAGALEQHGAHLTELTEHIRIQKPKPAASPSEEEKEPKLEEKSEVEEKPLLDETSANKKKRVGWI